MGALLLVSDVRRESAYVRSGGGEASWKLVHERLVSFAKRRGRSGKKGGCFGKRSVLACIGGWGLRVLPSMWSDCLGTTVGS